MTITFFGATRPPSAPSICFFSPVTAAQVRVRQPVVVVRDRVVRVGDLDPAAPGPVDLGEVRREPPGRLHRPVLRPEARRELAQVLAVRVQVVRREAVLDAPERPRPAELVGVVDELAVALLAKRLEGLRRATGVGVDRAPLGRPRDVVVARAADRTDVGRDVLLEDHHVARDAALGRRLPDDRCRVEPGLRPGRAQVVDHHRDRVLGGDRGRDEDAGQRRRNRRRGRDRGRASAWASGPESAWASAPASAWA